MRRQIYLISWTIGKNSLFFVGILATLLFLNIVTKTQHLYKAQLDVVKQTYCLDTSKRYVLNSETRNLNEIPFTNKKLKLNLRFSLLNLGAEHLILQKDFLTPSRTVIAKDMQSYNKDLFIFDVNGFIFRQFINIDKDFPPQEKFIILKYNEVFSKDITTYIDLTNFPKRNKGIEQYIMSQIYHIWGGKFNEARELRNKWKPYGNLLSDPVFVKPIQIHIKMPSELQQCKR